MTESFVPDRAIQGRDGESGMREWWWTDMRFLMIAGHTNTLRRVKAREGEAIIPCPVFFTAAKEPLPTVTGGMVLVLKRDCRLAVLR